jgi:hypothetical protein
MSVPDQRGAVVGCGRKCGEGRGGRPAESDNIAAVTLVTEQLAFQP